MIAHLRGTLLLKSTQAVIIDNAGVGYEVHVPLSTFYALPESGHEVELHIHTHVREDALALFGFHTGLEKDLFLMLISVSGIGPRLGINILSGIGPGDLQEAIARGDSLRLQSIPGVGRKTAERIVLELRERAQRSLGEVRPSAVEAEPRDRKIRDDALSALVNLGYPVKVARGAVEKATRMAEAGSLEELIKEALRILV
jgi:Holliday junction DNA helicase RuvA